MWRGRIRQRFGRDGISPEVGFSGGVNGVLVGGVNGVLVGGVNWVFLQVIVGVRSFVAWSYMIKVWKGQDFS